jgi:uncharacterized protein (TIGR03437 family)
MSLPTITRSKFWINWVVLIAAALLITPAFSQVANPSAVAFYYTYTQGNPGLSPSPQTVNFTDSSSTPINVISVTFTQPTYVNGGSTYTANAFTGQASGTSVLVAINIAGIQQVGNNIVALGGSYTGSMTVVTSAGSIDVPLTLNINTSGSSTITASPSSLALAVAYGGNTSSIISLTGATVTYTATATTVNGSNWLTVTQSGTTTPGAVTVTVSAAALTNGSYTGYVNISAGGTTLQVPVTLTVGYSSGSLSANPSTVAMSTLNASTPTSSTVLINSASYATSYTAAVSIQSGGSWLTLGSGQVYQSGNFSLGSAGLLLYANPTGLPTGTYSATVTVSSYPDGATVSVPVTLTVGSGGTGQLTVTPTSVSLSTTTVNVNPAPQYITLTAPVSNTYYTATASSSGWLTINSSTYATGYLTPSASLLVSANVVGLSAGTYSGTISISTTGGVTTTATIPVTLYVASSGGTGYITASPSSVSLSAPTLNVSPSAQYVTLTSALGTVSYTATASSSGWLTVNSSSTYTGTLTPTGSILIGANTIGLAAGTYSGTITINAYGGATAYATIPVTLTVGYGSGSSGTTVAPTSLSFSGQVNGLVKPGPQYIAIAGTGSYTATVSTASGSGWLLLESTSGNAPGWLTVTVNPAGMTAGTYSGTVSVVANGVTTSVPVSLNLTAGAAITANPAAVFTNAYSSSAPPAQTLYLTMSDTSAGATYTATSSASWITVSPATGTLNGSAGAGIIVQINPASLSGGLTTGSITVTVAGAANSPLTIPVTLNNQTGGTVNPGTGYLNFSQSSIDFNSTSTTSTTLLVSSSLSSPYFSVTAGTTTGSNWLYVTPSAGVAPSNVTVSVSPTGLAQGIYYGTLSFLCNGLTQNVQVTLTVGSGGGAAIAASPASLSFEADGTTTPAAQTVSLTSGAGNVSWSATVSTGATWVNLSPGAGALPGTTQVSVNPAGLTAGQHSATITFSSSSGSTTVAVNLNVKANPTVSASPSALTFNYRLGDAAPATQQIQVAAQSSSTALTWAASVTSGSSWLSVSPGAGTTGSSINVNVTAASLDPGTYNGVITVSGTNGAGGSSTINVTLTVTAPLPTITRVVNGASYSSGSLAPGEIIVISGTAIGPNETATGSVDTSTNRWATTVGGVQVLINGYASPVIYATSTQVAAIVPFSVSGRLDAFVQIRYRGVTSNTLSQPVTSAVPGIFTANSSGTGPAAALNDDGSVNGAGNPIAKGRTLVIFGTGDGLQQNTSGARPETGQVVVFTNLPDLPRTILPVAVKIDGQPCNVTYFGQAPGQVAGLFQYNVVVPATVGSGQLSLEVSVGENRTQSGVTVSVR